MAYLTWPAGGTADWLGSSSLVGRPPTVLVAALSADCRRVVARAVVSV